jgi:hypothetical protein
MQLQVKDGRSKDGFASGRRFFDGDDLVRGDVAESLHFAAGPDNANFFHGGVQSEAEVDAGIAGASVADGGSGFIPLRTVIRSHDPYLRAKAHAIAPGSHEPNKNPVLACGTDVAKELDRLIQAADNYVNASGVEEPALELTS